jgi:hypothetical protein
MGTLALLRKRIAFVASHRESIDTFAVARGRLVVVLSTTSFPDLFPQDLKKSS